MLRVLVCVVLAATVAIVGTSLHVSYGDPPAPAAGPAIVGTPLPQTALSGVPTWPVPVDVHGAAVPDPDRQSAPVMIAIPRLGVRAPVYDRGVDAHGALPIAPGYAITHFRYSAALGTPGNYVAYGHDDIQGSILRYLSRLRPGDAIELTQAGRRYVYAVIGRRVVRPTDLSVLRPTRNATLTLISCTPYLVDTERLVVTAVFAPS